MNVCVPGQVVHPFCSSSLKSIEPNASVYLDNCHCEILYYVRHDQLPNRTECVLKALTPRLLYRSLHLGEASDQICTAHQSLRGPRAAVQSLRGHKAVIQSLIQSLRSCPALKCSASQSLHLGRRVWPRQRYLSTQTPARLTGRIPARLPSPTPAWLPVRARLSQSRLRDRLSQTSPKIVSPKAVSETASPRPAPRSSLREPSPRPPLPDQPRDRISQNLGGQARPRPLG